MVVRVLSSLSRALLQVCLQAAVIARLSAADPEPDFAPHRAARLTAAADWVLIFCRNRASARGIGAAAS
jgi:hypothetical protein